MEVKCGFWCLIYMPLMVPSLVPLAARTNEDGGKKPVGRAKICDNSSREMCKGRKAGEFS